MMRVETGSAVTPLTRRAGSGGRPKSTRAAERIAEVSELICSQEDKPGTSKSSHQMMRVETGSAVTPLTRRAGSGGRPKSTRAS